MSCFDDVFMRSLCKATFLKPDAYIHDEAGSYSYTEQQDHKSGFDHAKIIDVWQVWSFSFGDPAVPKVCLPVYC